MTERDPHNHNEPRVRPWPFVVLGTVVGIIALIGAAFYLSRAGRDQPAGAPTPDREDVTALVRVTSTPVGSASEPTLLPTSASAPTPFESPVPTATPTPLPTATTPPTSTPTAVPTIAPTETPAVPTNTPAGSGGATPVADELWSAAFYDNVRLEGVPVAERRDAAINFNWGAGPPAGGVAADSFSARWTQRRDFPAGSYRFFARSNDGVRVYVNNVAILDDWRPGRPRLRDITIGLEAGIYDIQVEHYTAAGSAEVQVWWQRADLAAWEGSYFANPNLEGDPVLVRSDAAVRFDWQALAPPVAEDEVVLPADNFSVRWTQTVPFESGFYQFRVTVNDGVRLYVDGLLLIDAWFDGAKEGLVGGVWLPAGDHRILVEYYERRDRALIQVEWIRTDFNPTSWVGEYFPNRFLLGPPLIVRDDDGTTFDWDDAAPAAELPADNFSVRWRRTLAFEDGLYRLTATVDDGIRIYAGGQLVLDAWQAQVATTIEAGAVLRGEEEIVIEYFDATGPAEIEVTYERIGPPPE